MEPLLTIEPLLLTNSEMAMWRRCRRKWYLGTYRRLRSRTSPIANTTITIGNVVHEALAGYYDPRVGDTPTAIVVALGDAKIEERPSQEEAILKEREMCLAMVEGYVDWLAEEGCDADIEVEGTETRVEVDLAPGVRLLSKLDAPVRRHSDGAKLAFEHKTTSTLDFPLQIMKLEPQYLTEHLVRFLQAMERGATADEAQQQCQGVLVNMLRRVKRTAAAKPPFYGREAVTHNIEELRSHWKHCLAAAAQISAARAALDAGGDHQTETPPSPMKTCSWDCEFFRVCHMLDDGSDAEGALDAMYEEHEPLERYEGAEEL